jgi:integrase
MAKAGRVEKLTKRIVDASLPEKRRFIVWDAGLAGFGLRVEPTGRKTFIARYRAGGGRTGVLRQAMVGRYGTITLDEGRALARKLLGSAASGNDPVGDKKTARQAGITVAEVCDWYIKEAEAGRILGRRGRPIKASTLDSDRGRIEGHVKPLIGKRTVKSLSLRDMEEMQADIATGKTAQPVPKKRPIGGIPVGGGGVGARTLAMMSAIFQHAIRRQVADSNPAKGVRKMASNPRKFRLSFDQIRALGKAMTDAAADGESPTALAAIRLLLLTGFRRGEALGLKPGWIMPAGGIDFPDTKSGPQARPIGQSAMKLIKKQITSAENDEWIFPAERRDGHYVGVPKVLARVSKKAKLKGVTPHSLRHTFASVAGELGFSELTIAGLLGHSAGSVTSGYVHLDEALVAAATRVSATIADALDGKLQGKVIQMKRERR